MHACMQTRKAVYKEDVIGAAGWGIVIVGYGFSIWGLLGDAPAPLFVGVIFLAAGVCLLGLSRWLKKRRQKQSPFDPNETIGMDYYP